jgi:hypothetical protein
MARAIPAVEMLLVRGTGDATSDEQPSRRAVKMRRKKAEATEMRKATCSGPRRMVFFLVRVGCECRL